MELTEKGEITSADSGPNQYITVSGVEPGIADDTYDKPRERQLSDSGAFENPYEVPRPRSNLAQLGKAPKVPKRYDYLLTIAVIISLALNVVNFGLLLGRSSTTNIVTDVGKQRKFELGTIMLHTSTTPPNPWLVCNGQNVSRTQYSDLFALVGVRFGLGDGHLTFNLPDLRGRFALGHDPSENRVENAKAIGSSGGMAKQRLTVQQLPAHKHAAGSIKTQAAGDHVHIVLESGSTRYSTDQLLSLLYADPAQFSRTLSQTNRSTTQVSGNHTHNIIGETANTGKGDDFAIVPPFQTFTYIIYPI